MKNYTSSLFHYTSRLENIYNILKEGLVPNYCKEVYSTGRNSLVFGIPMISFCDIPLTQS